MPAFELHPFNENLTMGFQLISLTTPNEGNFYRTWFKTNLFLCCRSRPTRISKQLLHLLEKSRKNIASRYRYRFSWVNLILNQHHEHPTEFNFFIAEVRVDYCFCGRVCRTKCQQCKFVSYCSKRCKEADWCIHKNYCNRKSSQPLTEISAWRIDNYIICYTYIIYIIPLGAQGNTEIK